MIAIERRNLAIITTTVPRSAQDTKLRILTLEYSTLSIMLKYKMEGSHYES